MTDGNAPKKGGRPHISTRELSTFAMLGTLMFLSKQVMEGMPNVHLLGVLTMVCAIVYRVKGLIPVYVFIFLEGVFVGFSLWWVPYLYIWAVLWGATMLLPKKMHPAVACVVYPIVCGLHGFAYGTLYAPAQVLLWFGGDFSKMIPWIAAGFPYDAIHGFSNLALGILVYPLSKLLFMLERRYDRKGA